MVVLQIYVIYWSSDVSKIWWDPHNSKGCELRKITLFLSKGWALHPFFINLTSHVWPNIGNSNDQILILLQTTLSVNNLRENRWEGLISQLNLKEWQFIYLSSMHVELHLQLIYCTCKNTFELMFPHHKDSTLFWVVNYIFTKLFVSLSFIMIDMPH